MGKRYITDEIGNEYQNWTNGDIIFITASTGAGKSYFILNVYLDWIIQRGGKLLYLVNRRILREQLQNEVNTEIARIISRTHGLSVNIQNYIWITTYQALENKLKSSFFDGCTVMERMKEFTCVVCDECHYFYTDANFNTGTELSFAFIRELFSNKLQIYISATADSIKEAMENYLKKRQDVVQTINFGGIVPGYYKKKFFEEYGQKYNYGELCPYVVIDQDSLADKIESSICNTQDKWMVFVDSINVGRTLQKTLRHKSGIKENDIIFLDADYEKVEEAEKTVSEIVENKFSRKRVIISTAVMDNGITFQDCDLVNVAIFSDVKETFMQMLGRKRLNDNETIHLYICKRSEEYFKKRYQYTKNAVSTFYKYQKELMSLSEPYYHMIGYQNRQRQPVTVTINYIEYLFTHNVFSVYENPKKSILQQKILDVLLSNSLEAQHLKKFCYAVNGNISVNSLAVQRLLDLEKYYKDMVEKLKDNENAFLEQQFEWLGISVATVQECVASSTQELSAKYRSELEQSIEDIIIAQDGIMSEEENISWKLTMRKQLEYFLTKGNEYDENERKALGKNDRALSADRFNSEMKKADLHYVMKREGTKEDRRYIISSED